jgi:hypothetical protein
MTIAFLLIWLLVGIDVVGDGTTPVDPPAADEGRLATMDGPNLPPPPIE